MGCSWSQPQRKSEFLISSVSLLSEFEKRGNQVNRTGQLFQAIFGLGSYWPILPNLVASSCFLKPQRPVNFLILDRFKYPPKLG